MGRKEKVGAIGAIGEIQPLVLCMWPEIREGRRETKKISFSKSFSLSESECCQAFEDGRVGGFVCFRRAAENGCVMHLFVGLALHVLELTWKVMSGI